MITLISCNKIEGVDLLIVEPDKLVYEVGESFDPTGLEVSYLKNNGDVKELNADEYSISKVSINSTGVKEVTIKYLKIEKTFNVFVVAKKEAVTLVIKNYPTVQVYNSLPANSEIIKGLEVVVLFNDGKEETLENQDFNINISYLNEEEGLFKHLVLLSSKTYSLNVSFFVYSKVK